MALFKIAKGLKANLPSAKTAGYCWYTIDDSLFYIDYEDENGEVQRKALNAKDAEMLSGASLATILNESEVEIPTSKAVLDALDDRIKKVTLSDGNINIFEYESGIYQFVSENASGTLRIWGKSGTGDSAAAEFQEILAYSTVAAFINKAVSDTTTVWHFSHVNDSTSFYDVSYNSDTDTWTTIYSSELEQYVLKNQLLEVDSTLTQSGQAADAQVTGQKVDALQKQIDETLDLIGDSGTVSEQIEAAIENKSDVGHGHAINDVDGLSDIVTELQDSIDNKQPIGDYITKIESKTYTDNAVEQKSQVQIITWEADD